MKTGAAITARLSTNDGHGHNRVLSTHWRDVAITAILLCDDNGRSRRASCPLIVKIPDATIIALCPGGSLAAITV